jgi:hypothetical protein
MMDWPHTVCLAQGGYFLLTGGWPLLHMRSFLAVTGPKTELWLVRTVAALIIAISLPLLLAAVEGPIPLEVRTLALTAATALLAIDVIYVSKEVISPIYLADAAAEVALIATWLVIWPR